jgi:two-component system LytT family response regulator
MQLQKKLPDQFIRVHRAFIVNKEKIKEKEKFFNSKYSFSMKD